mgnify:CR=1 FL=1
MNLPIEFEKKIEGLFWVMSGMISYTAMTITDFRRSDSIP